MPCCRKLAGLPPCLGCGKRDVDGIESVAGEGPESRSLGPVPYTMLSPPKLTVDRSITAKRKSLQITLTNNSFDLSRDNPRALSPVIFLCFLGKEATSCIGKLAETALRSSWILALLCPPVNHCHEAVLSPEQLKTSSTRQLWAAFS